MNRTSDLVRRFKSILGIESGSDPGVDDVEWIVLAMGNPGAEYSTTRHNVGWWAADILIQANDARSYADECQSRTHRVALSDTTAIVALPYTYVNRSGNAARALIQKYRPATDHLIVVTDDINLPVGKLRIRRGGGAGGHNGVSSVISALGSDAFPRLRIGVGKQTVVGGQVDHVLGEPDGDDLDAINDAVKRAADAVAVIIGEGVDEAMNRFN